MGSKTARTVFESCNVRFPSLTLRNTRNDSSAVDTSTFSVGGNISGACVLRKNSDARPAAVHPGY